MIFFDTETCGFHGPCVLIQYAYDDGQIFLHNVWGEPIQETLDLIEEFAEHEEGVVGFNLAFDWFHIQKIYNMLTVLGERVGFDKDPISYVNESALAEYDGRDGSCVKAKNALDLMLHARKGPYQSTMDRKEIRVRRVPRSLAFPLSAELERRIPLNDIYFARRKDKTAPKWSIRTIKNHKTNKEDPDFVDIVLKFDSSTALKALVVDAGLRKADSRLLFKDVDGDIRKPIEYGWAPFAMAVSTAEKKWLATKGKKTGYAWPGLIEEHYYHWKYNEKAKEYAHDDVEDTRNLWKHFGRPPSGDNDSVLACMVGSVRWRGFKVNVDGLKKLRNESAAKTVGIPTAPHHVFIHLSEVMSEDEITTSGLEEGTGKVTLESISKMKKDCDCVSYEYDFVSGSETSSDFGETADESFSQRIRKYDSECATCSGTGTIPHPAAQRAQECLEARQAANKRTLFNKLIQAGRLHPSASVIGSLSSRMSGRTEVGDGQRDSALNALGIQHDFDIRKEFPLAHDDQKLCGGDFDAYEVSIAVATYGDEDLQRELLTCHECNHECTPDQFRESEVCPSCGAKGSRRKIHGLFAMALFPDRSYEDIVASKGTKNDMYDMGKRGLFGGIFYGGDENTLVTRLGIEEDIALQARNLFFNKYKGVKKEQDDCYENFCSMRQPGGIGQKVEWHDPAESVSSINGFERFFTLENKITRALYCLAEKPPRAWTKMKLTVVRRDREQKVGNAVRSALFAAAFQIQAQVMRAALNHRIQSSGAIETKDLQCRLWKLQPAGVSRWRVMPFNVHDEVMCPASPDVADQTKVIVDDFIEDRKSLIPLIKMIWHVGMKSWAEK